MTARSELTVKLAALATTLGVPLCTEGVTFSKPANNGAFIECFVMPSTTVNATVDGTRYREYGVFQCNVWSKSGVGTKQGEDIAYAIRAAFPVVPKTMLTSVEATPSIKQAIIDPSGYRIIPVVIQYRLEATV